MVLSQILQPSCVKVPLRGSDKHSVITELINVLDDNKMLSNKDIALEAIFTREQIRSTGIGFGVAIPHGKCKAVKESVMAIGIADKPIDFGSTDSKPVNIIALLISPSEQTVQHLKALSGISRLMFNESLRNEIQKTSAAQEVWNLLSRLPQNA